MSRLCRPSHPAAPTSLVQYIMNNSKIPVIRGMLTSVMHLRRRCCHHRKTVPIIIDSKTQYVAACNTVETLLVHRISPDVADPALATPRSKIQYRGDVRCSMVIDCDPAEEKKDFQTSNSDYILSIKVVDDIDEGSIISTLTISSHRLHHHGRCGFRGFNSWLSWTPPVSTRTALHVCGRFPLRFSERKSGSVPASSMHADRSVWTDL